MKNIFAAAALSALMFAAPFMASASVGISLVGGSVLVQQYSPFVEPGFSAFSTTDGDVTADVSASSVNTSVAGNAVRYYSVTDSDELTATAQRSITIIGASATQTWCSSPTAPGYNVSLPHGGCAGQPESFSFGQTFVFKGVSQVCQYWQGCVLPKN